ncbi:MAG: hypothetical protein HY046_06525 [Acidobacteria bacterium]|nr:hypothetical protein [Acidobacteriota bacterium]
MLVDSGRTKTRWAFITVRAFAVFNALFGGLGLALLADGLFRFFFMGRAFYNEAYYPEVFLIKTTINLICVLMLLVAAVFLWRLERRGLLLSNSVFCLELVYFIFVDSWLEQWLMMSGNERAQAIGHAIGATGGTGNMGIAPQIITGFPVMGLILLNLAYSRLGYKEIPEPLLHV